MGSMVASLKILKPTNMINFIFLLCCLAALLFPFSVAATNIFFSFAILLSLFSGHFKHGLILLWQQQRFFIQALIIYLSVIALGLLWSSDLDEGVKVLLHNSKWLLLPLLIPVLNQSKQHFNTFFTVLSIGLTAHLFLCLGQMFGLIDISDIAGSSQKDATGYIGHISFGIVYATWAGCLVLWGSQQQGYIRWLTFSLAAWAFTMVFLAQGRSGFLVAIAILLYLAWYFILRKKSWKIIMPMVLVALVAIVFIGNKLSDHPRAKQTLQSIDAIYHGDLSHAELRVFLWKSAFDLWMSNPILGIGTGSYKNAIVGLENKYPMLVQQKKAIHAHPHDLYLMVASRTGFVGFMALILLLWSWYRIGIGDTNVYLKFASLSALAIFIQGFTSIGLEEYHAISLTLFSLSAAISKA
jgi:O-antigen ligase